MGKEISIERQGIFLFNLVRDTAFTIVISPAKPAPPNLYPGYIALCIGKSTASFFLGMPGETYQPPKFLVETAEGSPGFVPERITSYWYSFDFQNLIVKYGKGYAMEETTLLQYNFIPSDATPKQQEEIRDQMSFIFSPTVMKVVMLYDVAPLPVLKQLYTFLKSPSFKEMPHLQEINTDLNSIYKLGTKGKLKMVEQLMAGAPSEESEDNNQGMIEVERKVNFYNFPLVSNCSPFVKDSSQVTLFDLDSNDFTFSASLPSCCIELYQNVINTDLNWPDISKYKLSDAIGYSMETEGCYLNNILKDKQGEFGPDTKNQVYLRVTLGPMRGSSPGFPYVLELWPPGCGSPIHNHGNTYAVIKVLHGGLTISIFNKDIHFSEKLTEFHVEEDDVTWISPNWYQSHQLWNHHKDDYCATIQCYQYGDDDNITWPYFDYLGSTDHIEEFIPQSDCDFKKMRDIVMAEYSLYMRKNEKSK